jgi:RNA polymerase sigma-70 factor (ECF subfamily)
MAITYVNRDLTLAEPLDASEVAVASLMNEEEFRAFYDRNSRPVWAYPYRIAGDRHQADDLLQEAFYRFYRRGGTHESEQHRRNSLFLIATNVARDAYRRRTPADHGTSELEESLNENMQTSRTAERVVASADLGRAMARLKPQQREMLWLAYAVGSSHDEIAAAVGVTRGSVKSLLFRARRKLADLLGAGEVART